MILIDGGYLTARSRYIFGNLTTSEGTPTGAIYGFLRILQQIKRAYPAEEIKVCMDSYCQWRAQLLPQYKLNRESHQEGYLGSDKQKQHAFEKNCIMTIASNIQGVTVVTANDSEADDIIAMYAEGNPGSIIFTSDKDMWQLTQFGSRITNKIDKGTFVFGDTPKDFIDIPIASLAFYRAVMGDSSDQIPKIKGIKTKDIKAMCSLGITSPTDLVNTDEEWQSRFPSSKVLLDNLEQLNINYELCKLPPDRDIFIETYSADRDEAISLISQLEIFSMKALLA